MQPYKRSVLSLLLLLLVTRGLASAELGSGVQQELTGPPGEHFGAALAVSGDYALVGQPGGVVDGVMMGRVLVYEYQHGRWVNVARLTPVGKHLQGARFGSTVALDGSSALVGAPGEHGKRGGVYLFERRDRVWTLAHKITPDSTGPKTSFGSAVALANDYAMVGAPGVGEGHRQHGAVYVFQRRDNVWITRHNQQLVPGEGKSKQAFGSSLAMQGATLLVGAPGRADSEAGDDKDSDHEDSDHKDSDHEDSEAGDHEGSRGKHKQAGTVYVFELNNDNLWREVARLQSSDGKPRDMFGSALALHGQEAVVGAPGHAGRGAVYAFQRRSAQWTRREVQKLLAPGTERTDQFGAAVALTESQLLSSAPDHEVRNRVRAGAVYVYSRQGSIWNEVEAITAPQASARAHFGYAMALSGQHAMLGAPGLSGHSPGRVYTYGLRAANTAPVITSRPVSSALLGSEYVYDVEATDADGDALTYRLRSAPGGMVIEPVTGRITWTPPPPGEVTVQVDVEVDDGHGGQTRQTYSLAVSLPNHAPQITSTPGTHTALAPLIPLLSVSDTHLAQYSVTLNGQPYVPGTAISAAGDYILTVAATDRAGNTSLKTVHFTLRRAAVP